MLYKRIPQWRLVSKLVGSEDIIMHSKSVYEWNGIIYEVLGVNQVKKKKILPTHYAPVKFEGRNWRIREVGEKSKLYKKIKNEK